MHSDPPVVKLWEQGAPGTEGKVLSETVNKGFVKGTWQPQVIVYLPPHGGDGTAMLVCPGGGYNGLAFDYEGTDVGQYLASQGIVGIVLKYRVKESYQDQQFFTRAMADARRAMRLARANSQRWKINPNRLGMMGFSAGANLTVSLATHWDNGDPESADPVERQGCRPSFVVAVYPPIGLKSMPATDLAEQITAQTPPAFIVHAADDNMVPADEATRLFDGLFKKNVAAELHIFPTGGHGFGLGKKGTATEGWPALLLEWLKRGDDSRPTTRKS